MKKVDLFILIYCIIVVFSVIYATQPLQPLFVKEFNISISKASQFTTVIMLFLAISPITHVYFLEKVSVKKTLLISLTILLITNILLSLSYNYEFFLLFRTIEALVIPAILISLMSIFINIDRNNIKRNMLIYFATTLIGSLIGRLFSGFIATRFSYEYVFCFLSLSILGLIYFINIFSYEKEVIIKKTRIRDLTFMLKDSRILTIYLLMFFVFFVFAGVLNILPFRLKELSNEISEFEISLQYLAYIISIIVFLYVKRIISFFRGESNTIIITLILLFCVILFLNTSNKIEIFILMLFFSLCLFIIYTVSLELINTLKKLEKSLVFSIYISFCYFGCTLGSYIPVVIYEKFTWKIVVYIFCAIIFVTIILMLKRRKVYKKV